MKLYTIEEVKKAIKADNWTHSENEILEKLTPIELPSDEEIDKVAFKIPYDNGFEFYDKSFIIGAKWLKEQILNQNK